MKYVISVFYADAEVTVKTNDPEIAILELLRADMNGNHAHVCNGDTGEVLALVNHPDQFATDEFSLMTLGVLMVHQGEEDEDEPAPANDEVPVLAVRCDAIPDSIQMMLEDLVTQGKAIRLPS